MDAFLLLLGFIFGFLLIYLIRLVRGRKTNCSRCGQQNRVNPKNPNPVCKKCGTPLKSENKKATRATKTGIKKKTRDKAFTRLR